MNWDAIEEEFDLWRAAEMTLPFWWRDDDAVQVTRELEVLLDLSQQVSIPVHLAVIPANLQSDLAPFVAQTNALIPVVHGFAHVNHATAEQKKCEFPLGRDLDDVQADLENGFQTLSAAFGERLGKVFVPPWNRFDPRYLPVLQDLGYLGFSTFTPRKAEFATKGVAQINTHVDPIAWHGTRSLADPAVLIDYTVQCLRDRRLGKADNAEPFGFLTHHLVHDAAVWAFSKAFLEIFSAGPTRVWSAAELEEG